MLRRPLTLLWITLFVFALSTGTVCSQMPKQDTTEALSASDLSQEQIETAARIAATVQFSMRAQQMQMRKEMKERYGNPQEMDSTQKAEAKREMQRKQTAMRKRQRRMMRQEVRKENMDLKTFRWIMRSAQESSALKKEIQQAMKAEMKDRDQPRVANKARNQGKDHRAGGVNPENLPKTTASLEFRDASGNNHLDGGETATVTVTVRNQGDGPAHDVSAQIQPKDKPHLSYPTSVSFGKIESEESVMERFQIRADREISSKDISLTFQFQEEKGFAPSPLRLQFETKPFRPPELSIADVGINDSNGNGVIEPGELVKVTARIRNSGRGRARDVGARVNLGQDVLKTRNARTSFDLGSLKVGEYQDIQFSLVTNQQAESVPVTLDLSEASGKYGKENVKLPLSFNQPTNQITEVQVEGQDTEVAVKSGDELSIDIETNIPATSMNRPDAVAVVIGVRNYSSEGVPNVKYARRDARVMRQYLTQMLGFREKNILPLNPDGRTTYAELRTLIQQKLPSYVKKGVSEVFVYYSGHGAPSTGEEKHAYLIPSDTDPNFVSDANAYRLVDFYEDLSKVGAKSVTVVLDACFTGQAGSGEMMLRQASPLALSVENPLLGIENATGFLASGSKQVANWYSSKKHGMFTYFFLKGLKGKADRNGDRRITVAEMEAYLTDENEGVPYYSRRVHQRRQMPQVVDTGENKILVRYDGSSPQNQ